MGKLIVIEGACDGVGKTTQYILLKEKLISSGEIVTSHHFPSYNTYHGLPVEKYLKGEFGLINELSPYFINNLYATDRAITWYTELKEKYNKGETILLDRYTTSSLIYQSALISDEIQKKDFIDYVIDFEYNRLGIKMPDDVMFLFASFDLLIEIRNLRKNNEGISNDIHERDIEFMKKVYESSMFVAEYLKWSKIDCSSGNNMKSINEIHEEICKSLKIKLL